MVRTKEMPYKQCETCKEWEKDDEYPDGYCAHGIDHENKESLIRCKLYESAGGKYAWISPNGDLHLMEMGAHESFSRKYYREKGMRLSFEDAKDKMVDEGWIEITGVLFNAPILYLHDNRPNEKQLLALKQYLDKFGEIGFCTGNPKASYGIERITNYHLLVELIKEKSFKR